MDKKQFSLIRPRPAPSSAGRRKRSFFGAIIAAVLLVGGAVLWLDSPPGGGHAAIFEILPGTPAVRIGHDLRAQGFIRSTTWFMGWVTVYGAAGKFRFGAYDVPQDMGARRLLALLLSGKTRRMKVVIPEGFASWQVAERLQALNVCLASDFENLAASATAEGTLFPDTYYFEEHMPPSAVLRSMQEKFNQAWDAVESEVTASSAAARVAGARADRPRWQLANGQMRDLRDILTMASLVEREARKPEERPIIAAVYYNRLKKRMYLEADPTVQYALGYWKNQLLYSDLDVKSPYNTYRHFGLPPGPICNPGRESLRAAFCPADVPYLYFVANQTGGHDFSETWEEHTKNVGARNRVRREMRRQQHNRK